VANINVSSVVSAPVSLNWRGKTRGCGEVRNFLEIIFVNFKGVESTLGCYWTWCGKTGVGVLLDMCRSAHCPLACWPV